MWRRQWHPTPVLLPGKSHGRRSLAGHSPQGHKESDTTWWLNTLCGPSTGLRNGKRGVKVLYHCPMNTQRFCLWNLLGWLKTQHIHLEPRNGTGGKAPHLRTQGSREDGPSKKSSARKVPGQVTPIPQLLPSSLKTFSAKAQESRSTRKGTVRRRFCFWLSAGNSWTARRTNLSILKEIIPECSLEGMLLKMQRCQYFGHVMQRAISFEKTLILAKIEGGMRRGDRGWDGWMASLTRWT